MAKENKKKSWLQFMQETGKNLWGNFADTGDVVYYLETLQLPHYEMSTLQKAEVALLNNLIANFTRSSIIANPKNKLKLQLSAEIDHKIGLVCCLAHELTLPATIALLGKMHYLSHHQYHEKLILVVLGTPVFKDAPLVNDLRNMLGKLQVSFCFVEAKA